MKQNILLMGLSFFSFLPFKAQEKKSDINFYHLTAKTIEGEDLSMDSYKGKVVLVVNTASKCGFTPQYEGLETLYKKYSSKGFVVLGFPCNQFAAQEPGDEAAIAKFCSLKYDVTFPMFMKVDVNGKNTHPIYKYLKDSLSGNFGNDVKWNFTKFLLDKKGKPVSRYAPTTKPQDLEADIEKLLSQE